MNFVISSRKPHSHNESYESLFQGLILLMYPDNSSYSEELIEDWGQWKSSLNDSNGYVRRNCFSDWSFPICENNNSDEANHALLKTVIDVESTFQLIVGVIGIISNLLAIPILCGKGMRSVFNKLLICLLILHTIYIFCSILSEMFWPEWEKDDQKETFQIWFIILFSFVLHPLKQFMLFSSIFITILMARQRYVAIRHPVEYHNSLQSSNPWKAALTNLMAVLIAAALLTFPLYLETKVLQKEKRADIININSTHFQYVSIFFSTEPGLEKI